MIELIFQKLRLVCKILNIAANELTKAQMRIKSRACLTLALQYVAEAWAQSYLTPPVEDYL